MKHKLSRRASRTPRVPTTSIAPPGARHPVRQHSVRSALHTVFRELAQENPPVRIFDAAQHLKKPHWGNAAGRMSGPQLRRYISDTLSTL